MYVDGRVMSISESGSSFCCCSSISWRWISASSLWTTCERVRIGCLLGGLLLASRTRFSESTVRRELELVVLPPIDVELIVVLLLMVFVRFQFG